MEKKIYYIDLPNPYDLEGPWINLEICQSKEDVKNFMWNHFGSENNFIQVVTEGMDDVEEFEKEN